MVLELGDSCVVRCRTSDLICELDFKTKVSMMMIKRICNKAWRVVVANETYTHTFLHIQGFFSGQYNSVSGKVKKESTGEVLYEISGQWSNQIFIKMAKVIIKP